MTSGPPREEPLSSTEQNIIDHVAEHGWSCMHVLRAQREAAPGGDEERPNFSYSIGWRATLSSPEAIVFGLPAELQQSMLWEVFRQLQAGAVLREGARFDGLLEGFACVARRVHPTQVAQYLGFANWYDRRIKPGADYVAAYQIFWPGKVDGLFPWEPGCHAFIRECQPQLQLPYSAARG